ncbi:hypothetical protein FJT64_004253 [Amphibalanus amphitrite]|uniref:Endonuclease/exonuclease/phosphatase domain-containing protein n=1 Tax=Amphibalanus amphitrite TaxID=1232801 RepID=A0A6A4VU95_AMPAM|nr:hypothetical protein FJT64_004253 [Amphibalanus amphitrite]
MCLHVPDVTIVQFADDTQLLVSGKKADLTNLVMKMERALSRIFACGGRRPQRRGARGRGSRRGSRPTSASRGLLIGALNVQSLRPKLLELSEVLHRQKYDIVLLAETWLKPTVPNRLLVIPGYSVHREDRPDGRGYGGVAVVAREDLTVTPLKPATQRPPDSRLETIWSLVRADRGRRLVLCSLYRPPRYTVTALDADFRDLETQVQSVRYCISVYGNGTKKNMVRVQKILNFAAKVIFGRGKFDHVADLRERLGWLEAQQLADHSTLCLAHRVLRRGEPHSLAAVLHRNEEVRQRATRQDGLLSVPRSRTEAGKRRFCARAPALHNQLPPELVSLSGQGFKRALKRRMLPSIT